MAKREMPYRAGLMQRIRNRIPDCLILINDPDYIQGIPDILVLFKNTWAMLEVKRSPKAEKRPNQDFFIEKLGKMSFASFINPDNEEAVLNAMESAFGIGREARASKS